jgi:hypothetical protein
VNNDAAGWNDPEYAPFAESEPTDPAEIKGNYTHTELSAQRGYKLVVPISMANDYNGYIVTYREYQQGDHYRKALSAWGPHASDYMATRQVGMGHELSDGPAADTAGALSEKEKLSDTATQGKTNVDLAHNDQRAAVLGGMRDTAIPAYEATLPDDAGPVAAIKQPANVERFRAAFFTWNGGSNYTDSPVVRVQRRVGGAWRDFADQSGEVQLTLKLPQGPDVASHRVEGQRWEWTAHFEVFASDIEPGERGRATPAGRYRFVAEGRLRQGGAPTRYEITSNEFEVRPWSGITVEDIREDDGTVSFKVGPRRTLQVPGAPNVDVNGGGSQVNAELGPIDYPDSYTGGAAFINSKRTVWRDPAAPNDPSKFEWYCFECSFRPWLDVGDAEAAVVTYFQPGGRALRVAANRGADGRWRTARALEEGEAAVVGVGCVQDRFGNYNGAASGRVGAEGGGAPDAGCPVQGVDDESGDGSGGGGPGTGGAPGGSGQTGVGRTIGEVLGQGGSGRRCARPVGRIRGKTVGRTRLGRGRRRNRRAFTKYTRPRGSMERFCLSDGRHTRIGYPPGRLLKRLGRSLRRQVKGEAVLIMTSSDHYSIRGIHPDDSVRELRRRFGKKLRGPFKVGRRTWYIAAGGSSRLVFKTRGRMVLEVGLANSRLTRGRLARRFLGSFY